MPAMAHQFEKLSGMQVRESQAPHFLWSSFGWGLSLSSPECNSGYFPTSMETQGIGQQVRLSVFFSWVGTGRGTIFLFFRFCTFANFGILLLLWGQ